MGESSRESEFVVFKERKLVATAPVYQGALRLSFLLETCPPGSVPDAYLLASVLDLVTLYFSDLESYSEISATLYCCRSSNSLPRMCLFCSLL